MFDRIRVLIFCIVCAAALCGCRLTGIKFGGFLTPLYRIPPGYSETYRSRLLQDEPPVTVSDPAGEILHGPYFTPNAGDAKAGVGTAPGDGRSTLQRGGNLRTPFPPPLPAKKAGKSASR